MGILGWHGFVVVIGRAPCTYAVRQILSLLCLDDCSEGAIHQTIAAMCQNTDAIKGSCLSVFSLVICVLAHRSDRRLSRGSDAIATRLIRTTPLIGTKPFKNDYK